MLDETTPTTGPAPTEVILDVASLQLSELGFDGLQLRDVARAARVSLSTVYRYFSSRDELILASTEHWMAVNVYRPMVLPEPARPLHESLVLGFRQLFAPWEAHPTMLSVFLRAGLLPGGDRLSAQGEQSVRDWAVASFEGYDVAFRDDVVSTLRHLTHGLMSEFATGRLDVGGIVSAYEVAVFRLTGHVPRPKRPRRRTESRKEV